MLKHFKHNVVNIVGLSKTEFWTDLKGNPYDGQPAAGRDRPMIEGVISLWEDIQTEDIPARVAELKRIHNSDDITAYIM